MSEPKKPWCLSTKDNWAHLDAKGCHKNGLWCVCILQAGHKEEHACSCGKRWVNLGQSAHLGATEAMGHGPAGWTYKEDGLTG